MSVTAAYRLCARRRRFVTWVRHYENGTTTRFLASLRGPSRAESVARTSRTFAMSSSAEHSHPAGRLEPRGQPIARRRLTCTKLRTAGGWIDGPEIVGVRILSDLWSAVMSRIRVPSRRRFSCALLARRAARGSASSLRRIRRRVRCTYPKVNEDHHRWNGDVVLGGPGWRAPLRAGGRPRAARRRSNPVAQRRCRRPFVRAAGSRSSGRCGICWSAPVWTRASRWSRRPRTLTSG